ncbi:hypothetical protein CPB85DRAFT_1437606 [Mucidula mucida]|nr:hypothetical protein CPB85DRAFT_1437606 [Mucidula mucida]
MSTNKTVFITGASTGIGLATSKLFFQKGWNVVATMLPQQCDATELSCEPFHSSGRFSVLPLDVTDSQSIAAAVKAAGDIDLLINNAGFGQYGVFEALSTDKVKAQFDVNVFGTMEVTRAILPILRSNICGGGIINISSGAGLWGIPMMSLYSASKHAIESVMPISGVSSTSFGANAMQNAVLADCDAYGAYITQSLSKMSRMEGDIQLSAEDVAGVIWEAATDGRDQLRYIVGEDPMGILTARYCSPSDHEYMTFMQAYQFQ